MSTGTNRIITPLIVAFVLLMSTPTFAGQIIYVDDDGPADFNNIQAAIGDSNNGDIIVVNPGIYTGDGNRDIDFLGKAITVRSIDPNDPNIVAATIIDCNGTEEEPHRGFFFHRGEDANSIVGGFTITNGFGLYEEELVPYMYEPVSAGGAMYCRSDPKIMNCIIKDNDAWYGGGICCKASSPTVASCTFIANSTTIDGGGMYNCDYSTPKVASCTFTANSATFAGGGMENYDYSSPILINCTFTGNTADIGGGMKNIYNSNPILTACTFSANSAALVGGAMSNNASSTTLTNCTFSDNTAGGGGAVGNYRSSPTFTDCNFRNNSATVDGGGMYNYWRNSPTLTNCTFIENSATSWGGGILNRESSMTVTNCTLIANSAGEEGGGIYNYNDCKLTLTKCTVVANSAPNGKALSCDSGYNMPSSVNVTNCILWNGGNEIWKNDRSTITVTYSDVQGGWPGIANIDADPCFLEPGYWDANGLWVDGYYRLRADSPCIDAGDPDYIAEPNETDLDGNPRLIDGVIDMGAYEYMPSIPAEARIVPRTINLASKGNWITCYIWLPKDYDVADIDPNSVFLESEIQAEPLWLDEQEQVAIAKFIRSEVQAILYVGEVELAITVRLMDGTVFEGTDTIRVTDKTGKTDR